jgi:hypothetical protein
MLHWLCHIQAYSVNVRPARSAKSNDKGSIDLTARGRRGRVFCCGRQGQANATLRVASEDVRTSETGKFVRKSGKIPYRLIRISFPLRFISLGFCLPTLISF